MRRWSTLYNELFCSSLNIRQLTIGDRIMADHEISKYCSTSVNNIIYIWITSSNSEINTWESGVILIKEIVDLFWTK